MEITMPERQALYQVWTVRKEIPAVSLEAFGELEELLKLYNH
jgi:hypothetical protein